MNLVHVLMLLTLKGFLSCRFKLNNAGGTKKAVSINGNAAVVVPSKRCSDLSGSNLSILLMSSLDQTEADKRD